MKLQETNPTGYQYKEILLLTAFQFQLLRHLCWNWCWPKKSRLHCYKAVLGTVHSSHNVLYHRMCFHTWIHSSAWNGHVNLWRSQLRVSENRKVNSKKFKYFMQKKTGVSWCVLVDPMDWCIMMCFVWPNGLVYHDVFWLTQWTGVSWCVLVAPMEGLGPLCCCL